MNTEQACFYVGFGWVEVEKEKSGKLIIVKLELDVDYFVRSFGSLVPYHVCSVVFFLPLRS